MEELWISGIALIRLMRDLAPGLVGVMSFITDLGGTYFYLLLVPAIYWSVDLRLGRKVVWLLLLSFGLNTLLKTVLRHPRPYWVVPDLPVLHGEGGFGLPSGHSQHAAAVWGSLAFHPGFTKAQRRWLVPFAVTLVALIGLSRIYLGVHFGTDVLGGWLLGAGLVWAWLRWESFSASWSQRLSRNQQVLSILCAVLVVGGIAGAVWSTLQSWRIPPEWQQNALANSGTPIDSLGTRTIVGVAGILVGVVAGLTWNARRGPAALGGALVVRLARLLWGLAGAAVLWFGLSLLGEVVQGSVAQSVRFARYALLALWVAGVAPSCFRSLGLAHEPPPA